MDDPSRWSPDQWATAAACRDELIERVLGPYDHDRIAAATAAVYKMANLPAPRIEWVDGPLTMAWNYPKGRCPAAELVTVRNSIMKSCDSDTMPRSTTVFERLAGPHSVLDDHLQTFLDAQPGASGVMLLLPGDGWRGYRRWWFHRLTIALCIRAVRNKTSGWEGALRRDALDLLTMYTSPFVVPREDVVYMVDRHTDLHFDNQQRLHSATGPAWGWADGTAVHALDGITVPRWVVEAPNPTRILSADLPNTEHRRVAMAHYGWARAAKELCLEIIDEHPDPTWGTLYRLPVGISERPGQATLLVAENASPDRDGTTRIYGLLADGRARTVVAAQASLAQLSESEWLMLDGAS